MPGNDLRAAERHRCWLKAMFVFNNGCSTLEALTRNVSETGALLSCEDIRLLPESFDLIIGMANGEQVKRKAQQVWSRDGAIGVKFTDGILDAPVTRAEAAHPV
jgi:hypothetical protein